MKKTTEKSLELFRRASNRIVGGVNSPARAFRAVGMSPLFIERAKGSRIWDADGRKYINFSFFFSFYRMLERVIFWRGNKRKQIENK